MTEQKLLPCPFCQSDDVHPMRYDGADFCQCHECFASTRADLPMSEAIEAWNTRSAQPVADGFPGRQDFDKWFRFERSLSDEADTTFIGEAFLPYRAWAAALNAVTPLVARLHGENSHLSETRSNLIASLLEVNRERDNLKAEVERLTALLHDRSVHIGALDSELTEARELLTKTKGFIGEPEAGLFMDITNFLSNQSAPAAKGDSNA